MVAEFDTAFIALVDDPSQRVLFQVFPDSIDESKTANWASIEVIGRSEPIRVYAGSGPRTFSFTMTFVASVDASDYGNGRHVWDKVQFLQSLTYPVETDSGILDHPPLVWFQVGYGILSRCICRQASVSWRGPWDVVEDLSQGSRPKGEIPKFDKFMQEGFEGLFGSIISNLRGEKRPPEQGTTKLPNLKFAMFADVALALEEVADKPHHSEQVRFGARYLSNRITGTP